MSSQNPDSEFARAQNTLQQLHARIENACARAHRDTAQVLLIGASKTVDAAKLQTYFAAGLTAAGENYVQEGVAKIDALGNVAQWHFIGALQSNKARDVVANFSYVHSLDRISLGRSLDRECEKIGRTLDVLLQVNVGNETSKAGCAPDELSDLFERCAALPHLRVCGLMCLPQFRDDAQEMRDDFKKMRELLGELRASHSSASTCTHLSMGMSNDFEVAIEEGATMIRVGTSLFGARN